MKMLNNREARKKKRISGFLLVPTETSGAPKLISCFIHSNCLHTDKPETNHNAHIWQRVIVESHTTVEL